MSFLRLRHLVTQSRTKKDNLMCVPSALQHFSRLQIPLGYILYNLD